MPNDKRTNEELHRALWRWLAETGSKWKREWPEWKHNGGLVEEVKCLCFACYAMTECDDEFKRCPIRWAVEGNCNYGKSEYKQWNCLMGDDSGDVDERKRIAAIIAELPWKEGGWK